jgi:biotin-(acetyl-CoA carboxylase) ligase
MQGCRATSLALVQQEKAEAALFCAETRFWLLEKTLEALHDELNTGPSAHSWRERLEERLFRRGENIVFAPGGRGSDETIEAVIKGIGADGELIVQTANGEQIFFSGEIRL